MPASTLTLASTEAETPASQPTEHSVKYALAAERLLHGDSMQMSQTEAFSHSLLLPLSLSLRLCLHFRRNRDS